jgi:hypothetical protein
LTALYGCAVTAGPFDLRLLRDRLSAARAANDDALALQGITEKDPARLSAADRARVDRVVAALPPILEATAQIVHALSQRLARRLIAGDGSLAFYEATPRLAIVSLEPSARTLTVDLRRNGLRVVGRGASAENLVRTNLARGVLDGVIEDTIVGFRTDAGIRPFSTVTAMETARAQNIAVSTSRPGGTATVTVGPARPVQVGSAPRMAWWSVDQATGETVGVLDSGLHGAQDAAEYGALVNGETVWAAEVVDSSITVPIPPEAFAPTEAGLGGLGATTASAAGDVFLRFWSASIL